MKRAVAVRRLATLTCIRGVIFAAAMSMSLLAVPTQSHAATTDQPDGIRMMLKVQIPPEGGNQAIKAGQPGRDLRGADRTDQTRGSIFYPGKRTAHRLLRLHNPQYDRLRRYS